MIDGSRRTHQLFVIPYRQHQTHSYTTLVFFFQGAILIEVFELWEGKEEYMKDHWNILDVLALAFCGAAFLVRISDPDSLWGRALYGAGTPLLLCRILFFAQFLPAQGPMIEVNAISSLMYSGLSQTSTFATHIDMLLPGQRFSSARF